MEDNSYTIKTYKVYKILFVIYTIVFAYELIFKSYEENLSTGIGWLLMFIGLLIFWNKIKKLKAEERVKP
jgi:hypothetical protein